MQTNAVIPQQALNPWVSFPNPKPQAQRRFFCFPYAGGGTSIFRDWQPGLPEDTEVCLVHLPGHDSRIKEAPIAHLTHLLEVMIAGLMPYLDRPFALYGHSMGALLAFESARWLQNQHQLPPEYLFVSGSRAPQQPSSEPPTHHLSDGQLIQELQRRYQAIPPAILQDAEYMQFFLPILRADFSIIETYRYVAAQSLNCPISTFGGREDPMVSQEAIAAWRAQTTKDFTIRMLPGDHFFINAEKQRLVRAISEDLDTLS